MARTIHIMIVVAVVVVSSPAFAQYANYANQPQPIVQQHVQQRVQQHAWNYPPIRVAHTPVAHVPVAQAHGARYANCGCQSENGPADGPAVGYGNAGYGDAACGAGGYGGGYADYGAYGASSQGYLPAACAGPPPVVWDATVGALFMTRDKQNPYRFSFDSANEEVQLVNPRDANMDWAPGLEVSIGRFDQRDQTGFVVTYWQLFPGSESTQALGADLTPGFLDGIRNYNQLDYNGGTADANVNNAVIHRLTRDWEIYSLEASQVRLFSQGCGSSCGSPWSHSGLWGFRYVNFSEDMLFVSDPSETIIDNDADEYRIDVETDNQMFGFQLGGISERAISCNLSLRFGARVGIYGNRISMDYFEGGAAGAAVINNGPNNGRMLRVNGSKNDVATIGEFSLGLSYRVGRCWRVGADYRVLGVSGVALPSDQLFSDTRGIQDIEEIDSNGSVILHGAVVRIERSF